MFYESRIRHIAMQGGSGSRRRPTSRKESFRLWLTPSTRWHTRCTTWSMSRVVVVSFARKLTRPTAAYCYNTSATHRLSVSCQLCSREV